MLGYTIHLGSASFGLSVLMMRSSSWPWRPILNRIGHDTLTYMLLRCIPPGVCKDRKSTRLNSSHGYISYAVFCLKKKKKKQKQTHLQKNKHKTNNYTN